MVQPFVLKSYTGAVFDAATVVTNRITLARDVILDEVRICHLRLFVTT